MPGFNATTGAGTTVEYGVQYDMYYDAVTPFVTTVTADRWLAESAARRDANDPGIVCHVVARTVSFGEWSR